MATNGLDNWRREVMRIFLAMSTAAGTVYTSVRSALTDHETRLTVVETRQKDVLDNFVRKSELESVNAQLAEIKLDVREIRAAQIEQWGLNAGEKR